MPQVQYGVSASGAGVTIQRSLVRSGDHSNSYEINLPAGKAVTSWVKTDADTAACDLPSGHGYTTGTFDVYWPAGRRYGVAGTITSNAIALEGGSGDDFPASATTGVVVTAQVTINTAIDGDAIVILAICAEFPDAASTAKANIDFQDSGAASIEAITLTANAPIVYDVTGGATNVFTGNPITVGYASNGSSSDACTLKIVSLEDSTP